jgi:hypothetical protein
MYYWQSQTAIHVERASLDKNLLAYLLYINSKCHTESNNMTMIYLKTSLLKTEVPYMGLSRQLFAITNSNSVAIKSKNMLRLINDEKTLK